MQDEINDLKEEIKKLKSQLQSNQGYFKDPAQKDLFDSGEYHLPSAPVPGAYMTVSYTQLTLPTNREV